MTKEVQYLTLVETNLLPRIVDPLEGIGVCCGTVQRSQCADVFYFSQKNLALPVTPLDRT